MIPNQAKKTPHTSYRTAPQSRVVVAPLRGLDRVAENIWGKAHKLNNSISQGWEGIWMDANYWLYCMKEDKPTTYLWDYLGDFRGDDYSCATPWMGADEQ